VGSRSAISYFTWSNCIHTEMCEWPQERLATIKKALQAEKAKPQELEN
jgi:hypothetical protein